MSFDRLTGCARPFFPTLLASLIIAGCGGGGSIGDDSVAPPASDTGTVGLLFTDKPTDEFSAIKLNVLEAILIGGDGQQTLFQGSKPIDLLNLTNYSEPIVFGEVPAKTYTKLRLVIDALELVPNDGGASIFPKLPANGKIDLLDPGGITVLPGRTLLAEIDMDANKSIKITAAGNSRKYNFRPVVRTTFMDGGLPDKLARVEGIVSEIFADPAGSFLLCGDETSEFCITVNTDADSSLFDDQGSPTDFGSLMIGDAVVVIGRYLHDDDDSNSDSGRVDGDIELLANVVEIGGNAEQIKGNVVSTPVDNQFLLQINDNGDIVVELQDGTKYFNAEGEINADSIVVGADIEVEGVRPAKDNADDPDSIRAALIFVAAEDDLQLSGTIIEPLDTAMRSFGLMPVDGNDTCVRVDEDAAILLVDTAASEVTTGTVDDLALGQFVDLFGAIASDSCFDANEVIVDINGSS